MPPSPTSLTIISLNMKTVKDYNLPLNLLKHKEQQHENKHCAILPSLCRHVKAKQSTAEYGRRLCLFCPSNKLTFDLLTLKVVSESCMTWAISMPILVFLGLCSRLRPDVRDRQTDRRQTSNRQDRRQTASSLNAPAY